MKKIIGLLFFCNFLWGQSSIRVGEWVSYLPYQIGLDATQSNDFVYYSTGDGILKIDKEDFSTTQLSKVDGLNDVGIQTIEYDNFNERLIVAYNNSNIDILSSSGVTNLPNILSNTDLAGNKKIYDIHIRNEDEFFLGTGFGLVQIFSDNLLFGFSTFTDIPVLDLAFDDARVFISTEDGIYFAPLDGSVNLIDFSLWELLGANEGLPSLYASLAITRFNGTIYLEADNTVYRLEDNIVTPIYAPAGGFVVSFLSAEGSDLMIGLRHPNQNSGVVFISENGEITESAPNCSDRVVDVLQDEFGRIWYGDEFGGFRSAPDMFSSCSRLSINSPFSNEVNDIAFKDEVIYVASGGIRDNYDYNSTRSGYYILKDRSWSNFNPNQTPFLRDNDLINAFAILPDPEKELLYVGTYWGGLIRHDLLNDTFILFDDTNSSLMGTVGDEQRERVTGLAFDDNDNLWVTSFGSPEPIALLTKEEEWFSFRALGNNNLIDIAIDEFGYLWMPAFGNNGGCLVYDPGEDITNSTDDRYRFINAFDSELTTNIVNSVKIDLGGEVWLGTAEGPVIFDCGNDPFDRTNCTGNRIKVIQDSIVAFLLADQDVLSIEVDGANQKWLGTRNGIFVQSPDGETEVLRFNEKNSPLFNNRIRDLEYNNDSGEMIIGTDRGLQAYRTRSAEGQLRHRKEKVYVFPNPVEPSYHGPIAIKGLIRDAFVQITDVNGQLVTELRALGGQAIWDGRDLNGVNVKSGVYLIFSSDDRSFDRPDAFVTKLMVIR